ncbi:acyl-coenzyme A synthetase ACSM3 [Plectosphaerella plurivora]|uniref:medium-chain acyl-CoA ligase n=1 Tax=Plectosphaerella plurivora TaxID=936078 RepID=A0A9P8V0L8_9PEZI|nr:acyl-coenzyme A synthetase ACSM3 [Plectosphaerella plurivora]
MSTIKEIVSRQVDVKHFNFAIDVVDEWAASSPDLRAMLWTDEDGANPRDLSFRYFSQRSHRAARLLRDLGVQKGDTAMFLLPRVPAWWEIATGALRAGVVVSPCPTLATAKDISFRANASKATCLVGDAEMIERFLAVRHECPTVKYLLQVDDGAVPLQEGALGYEELVAAYPPDTAFRGGATVATDPAFIFFTSGTSGPPKMVVHNHLYPLGHVATGKHWLMLEPGKLYWNMADQGWAKAAWSWFSAWNAGAALFVQRLSGAFSPSTIIKSLHNHPITTLCVPPTAFRRLVLPDARELLRKMPPARLEHSVAAGEALEADLIRAWKDMTGIEIKDGYGQTETPLLCGNLPGYPVKPGSMGLPIPGMPLSVVDEDGRECGIGVEGNIALAARDEHGQAPFGIFEGYLASDGTKKLDLRQGADSKQWWYLTGDKASRDEDGYFWFIGRADDVINSSGYRIGPSEVEAVLQEHPCVVESAVVASPSAERGDVVKAFIILSETARTEDQDRLAKDIQEHCKRVAAPYKYPRRIEFVGNDFFPRTTSGKIQRAKLREWERAKQVPARARL